MAGEGKCHGDETVLVRNLGGGTFSASTTSSRGWSDYRPRRREYDDSPTFDADVERDFGFIDLSCGRTWIALGSLSASDCKPPPQGPHTSNPLCLSLYISVLSSSFPSFRSKLRQPWPALPVGRTSSKVSRSASLSCGRSPTISHRRRQVSSTSFRLLSSL